MEQARERCRRAVSILLLFAFTNMALPIATFAYPHHHPQHPAKKKQNTKKAGKKRAPQAKLPDSVSRILPKLPGGEHPPELARFFPSSDAQPEIAPAPDGTGDPALQAQRPVSTTSPEESNRKNDSRTFAPVDQGENDPAVKVHRDDGGDDDEVVDEDHNGDDAGDSKSGQIWLDARPEAPYPPYDFSRQPAVQGGFLDASLNGDALQSFTTDFAVHEARLFRSLGNNEEITFKFYKPNSDQKAPVGTCTYKYQVLAGKSASALDAKCRLEIRTSDARHSGSHVVFCRTEGTHLSILRTHVAAALREAGDWRLIIERNGQVVSDKTLTVKDLPAADTGWWRYTQGAFRAAGDPAVAYTQDENLVYSSPVAVPSLAKGDTEQTIVTHWELQAPAGSAYNRNARGAFWTLDSKFHYDLGTDSWSNVVTVSDLAYKNRVFRNESGQGHPDTLLLQYGEGLPPVAGNFRFSAQTEGGKKTTQTIAVRDLRASVKSLSAATFLDNHKVPYELSFSASGPDGWVPSNLAWSLTLAKPDGSLIRTLTGTFSGNSDATKSWVVVWDTLDNDGQNVPFGTVVSPSGAQSRARARLRYRSPEAFRQAMMERLRQAAELRQVPFPRVQMRFLFERLWLRIQAAFPNATLKGGAALEFRLERARTTRDLDLGIKGIAPDQVLPSLQSAGQTDFADFITFEFRHDPQGPALLAEGMRYEGRRLRVMGRLAGKPLFNAFGLDIAVGEPASAPDRLLVPSLMAAAGFEPLEFSLYSLETHVAEKLHAYTMPRTRPNSRVKDLPDLALLGTLKPSPEGVRTAIESVYTHRDTHPIPQVLPFPPSDWSLPYAAMAAENSLPWPDLTSVHSAAADWINPLLS